MGELEDEDEDEDVNTTLKQLVRRHAILSQTPVTVISRRTKGAGPRTPRSASCAIAAVTKHVTANYFWSQNDRHEIRLQVHPPWWRMSITS